MITITGLQYYLNIGPNIATYYFIPTSFLTFELYVYIMCYVQVLMTRVILLLKHLTLSHIVLWPDYFNVRIFHQQTLSPTTQNYAFKK
jgi:hypothetical protein